MDVVLVDALTLPSYLNMEPDKTQEGFQWVKQELLNRMLLQATDPRVYPCKLTQSLLYNGKLAQPQKTSSMRKDFRRTS